MQKNVPIINKECRSLDEEGRLSYKSSIRYLLNIKENAEHFKEGKENDMSDI